MNADGRHAGLEGAVYDSVGATQCYDDTMMIVVQGI